MTTKYVNSGAAGANDGTSWTDAWTSLASSNGVAAGDIVKVHKTHSQTGLGSNISWTNGTASNPVRIICVDKDASDALDTGALVAWNATNTGPVGNIYSRGVNYRQATGNLQLSAGSNGLQSLEQCTLSLTGSGYIVANGSGHCHRWTNVSVDLSGGSASTVRVELGGGGGSPCQLWEWIGGTYTCRSTQTDLVSHPSTANARLLRGITFSGTVTNLIQGSTAACGVVFDRCTMPTFTNVYGTAPAGYQGRTQIDSVSGTLTVALLNPVQVYDRCGTVKAITSRYRTSGADDGSQANAYSWELVSNANAAVFAAWLATPPITRWVAAGSQVLKVYVASGVTLNDDEFWIEVLSPSEAGSATAQAAYRTTRCNPLATPAALTTDGSSTWNGSGVGTKQYATVTIAPTIPGPVVVRVCYAKASTTVYVDPVIDVAGDVSGKSRMFESVQNFDATTSGGSGNPNLLRGLAGKH